MRLALAFVLVACNSFEYRTYEFEPTATCGQGPFDLEIPSDGTSAEDGVEVIACTPRRLAGQVQLSAGDIPLPSHAFGDVADNQRCLAGGGAVVTTVTTRSTASASTPAMAGGAGGASVASGLVARPYRGTESAFGEDLCAAYGRRMQVIAIPTTVSRHTDAIGLVAGARFHVRIWSDLPNDLSDVIFLVRQLRSPHAPEHSQPEPAAAHDDTIAERPPVPSHGPPPPPLTEEGPSAPRAGTRWTPGYWTWTGRAWGWLAGSWRDAAAPPMRVEDPGAPPAPSAVWIVGTWQLRAGAWVWIGGRWRR